MRWDADERKNLVYLFMDVVDKAGAIGAQSMDFGTGKRLSQAEIHLVARIAESPGIHANAIAEEMGVTRGAVSQIVAKIERKGLVRKVPDPSNRSRFLLRLTREGSIAAKGHREFHKRFDTLLLARLSGMDGKSVRTLEEFFEGVLAAIEKAEK